MNWQRYDQNRNFKVSHGISGTLAGCHTDYKTNLSSQLDWHWTCQLELSLAILDNRQAGTGLDIEIEVIENNCRGNVMLKLYGSSKKKVILVTKSKGSESLWKYLLKSN